MDIVIHAPKSPEQAMEFNALAAKIHSQYIAYYINKLSCPIEQKRQLIDAIAETLSENAKKEKEKGKSATVC